MNFVATKSGTSLDVYSQQTLATNALVLKNRRILQSVADVVLYLGRQGLPFRSHREDQTNDGIDNGNFLGALNLRADGGDHYLAEHLNTHAKMLHTCHHKCKMSLST